MTSSTFNLNAIRERAAQWLDNWADRTATALRSVLIPMSNITVTWSKDPQSGVVKVEVTLEGRLLHLPTVLPGIEYVKDDKNTTYGTSPRHWFNRTQDPRVSPYWITTSNLTGLLSTTIGVSGYGITDSNVQQLLEIVPDYRVDLHFLKIINDAVSVDGVSPCVNSQSFRAPRRHMARAMDRFGSKIMTYARPLVGSHDHVAVAITPLQGSQFAIKH